MTTPLFTQSELQTLSIPYPDRIERRIRRRDIDGAMALTHEMAESRILLHDFYADSCTVLWSFIGDHCGEDAIEPMFRYIFARSAARQFFDAAGAQVLPHLSVLLLAKSWRAHSCFGKGDHPGNFSITEDAEKFTFHLHPCGSGARLWKKGWYANGAGGKLSQTSHPWTYNRKNFPYYCIHCPFLNEILPYESGYGALLWPVDPPDSPSGNCAWHIYKNPNAIPERYYERLGLSRKPVAPGPYPARTKPFFSDNELTDMARPTTDRILEKLERGDTKTATRLCREVTDEFLVLHDLYVNMLASTLSFIAETGGEASLEKALDLQFTLCINRQIIKPVAQMPARETTKFLAGHIFGTDNCNGCGYIPGKFKITETDTQIIFSLNPCGSGGRLVRAGTGTSQKNLQKWRERMETGIVTFLSHRIPLPEPLVRWIFPYMVNHFTQRKPFSLGKTAAAHPWSFHRLQVPYFCCQCGMLQQKLGNDRLQIIPPTHKRDACVWKLKK